MASNQLPANGGQLIGLATKMVAGMVKLAEVIPVKLITTQQIETDLAAFTAQDSAYNSARSARQADSDNVLAAAAAIYD